MTTPILLITLLTFWDQLAADDKPPIRKSDVIFGSSSSLSLLPAPLTWDAVLDNLVERIDRAIPELGLLTDRQGIISMTDMNGNPCQWPNCNFGLGIARTVEQP